MIELGMEKVGCQAHPLRHFRIKPEPPIPAVFPLGGYQRPQQDVFVLFEIDRIVGNLDVLGEGPDGFPPITALSRPEAAARLAPAAERPLMWGPGRRRFAAWSRSLRCRRDGATKVERAGFRAPKQENLAYRLSFPCGPGDACDS